MFNFSKWQCLGNDILIVPEHTAVSVAALLHRNLGIGGDQALVLHQVDPVRAYVLLDIVNQDGSLAGQCLNGMLCLSLFLLKHYPRVPEWTVSTGSDARRVVCMPPEVWVPKVSCVRSSSWRGYELYRCHVGNPHVILLMPCSPYTYTDEAWAELYSEALASGAVEASDNFSVMYITETSCTLRTWERGVGSTLACGSAALAAAAIAAQRSSCPDHTIVFPLGGYQASIFGDGGRLSAQPMHVFSGTLRSEDLEGMHNAYTHLKTSTVFCLDRESMS